MIISHRHKFIFLKTEKTASTSIEIALSKYCGKDDIITPITKNDEEKRQKLGYPGPQNYLLPFAKYSLSDFVHLLIKRERVAFYNHCDASFIRQHISENIWNSYFKFCFERNPWDRTISLYYWRHRKEPRPTIMEFIQSGALDKIKAHSLYMEGNDLLVDKVYKYEEIDTALHDIATRCQLGETPAMPTTKTEHRKDHRNYREVLNDAEQLAIKKIFEKEIQLIDYQW